MGFIGVSGRMILQHHGGHDADHIVLYMGLRGPFDKESILEYYLDAEAGDVQYMDTDRAIRSGIYTIYKAIGNATHAWCEKATWQILKLVQGNC